MLSNNLIKNFIKSVSPAPKKTNTSSLYGTLRIDPESSTTYVQIDGSDEKTPIVSTVSGEDGDRVTVTIQNHVAIVDGNVTNTAMNLKDLDNEMPEYLDSVKDDVKNDIIPGFIDDVNKDIKDSVDAAKTDLNKNIKDTIDAAKKDMETGMRVSVKESIDAAKKDIENKIPEFLDPIKKDVEEIMKTDIGNITNFVTETTQKFEKYDDFLGSTMETNFSLDTILGGSVEGTVINEIYQSAFQNGSKIQALYEIFEVTGEGDKVASGVVKRTSEFIQTMGEFKTSVEANYVTKDGVKDNISQFIQTDQGFKTIVSQEISGKGYLTSEDAKDFLKANALDGYVKNDPESIKVITNSVIEQTSSEISSTVSAAIVNANLASKDDIPSDDDVIAIVESNIKQTASSIRLAVTSTVKQDFNIDEDTIDDLNSKFTRDAVIELINRGTGGSQVRISASQIIVDGEVVAKNHFGQDSTIFDIETKGLGVNSVELNVRSDIMCWNLLTLSNGLSFGGSEKYTFWPYSFTAPTPANQIVKANGSLDVYMPFPSRIQTVDTYEYVFTVVPKYINNKWIQITAIGRANLPNTLLITFENLDQNAQHTARAQLEFIVFGTQNLT